MKHIKALVLVLALVGLLVFAGSARAQEPEPAPQNPVALFLAGVTGLSYDEIVSYRDAGYGLGQIGRALQFARATDQSLDDVLAQAQETGWGRLYREAGLHPGGQGLGALLGRGHTGERPAWAGGPPDHAGAPEHAGPPEHTGPKEDRGPGERGAGRPDHAGPKNRSDEGDGD